MSLLDDIYRHQHDREFYLQPPPAFYKFSGRTLAQMLPELRLPADAPIERSGHIWGIPFVISAGVPDDTILYTTDFETWQAIKVAP